MTLTASALQGTEDVSAMLVNTSPCIIDFLFPAHHHHSSNIDSVWYISQAPMTAMWMMENHTVAM